MYREREKLRGRESREIETNSEMHRKREEREK